jgi:MFS superfamily sulfate permease-like transporter
MSLNDWSLVMFGVTGLYYAMLYWTVFRRPNMLNYIILICTWLLTVGMNLVYGIATRQVGFIFIFLSTIALAMAVLITTERSSNDS